MICAAALLSLAACDNIAEEDRLIPVIRPAAKQTYVIQEFSGQRCVNCPDGAAILHQIQNTYGEDAVIVVGLHPKDTEFTKRLDRLILTSDAATTYYDYWGRPTEFPCAIINGTGINKNRVTWISSLDALVDANKDKDPCANIGLECIYDPDTRELNLSYEVYFTQTYGSEASLVLWVCENDIVGQQYNLTGTIRDYHHNHVLRCALNGDWGDRMTTTLMGTSDTGSLTARLDESWNAENCVIVGYLFDTSSKLGLQGAQLKVPAKQGDNVGSETE